LTSKDDEYTGDHLADTEQIRPKKKSRINDAKRSTTPINLKYRDLIIYQISALKRTTWVDQPKIR